MPVFLFTNIEKFSEKWEKHQHAMSTALALHDSLTREVVKDHEGRIIKHTGQGFFVVFEGDSALTCALALQFRFGQQSWGELVDIRIGIGIHAGDAQARGDDFFGPIVNRAARLMQAAWGGQILFSPEVRESSTLPSDSVITDLGNHLFADLSEPQKVLQLSHPDMQINEFPPIDTLSSHLHNLPVQTTPFIGRKDDIISIQKTILGQECRIINIIGPGGIGKTRLALQVAAELVTAFGHGVYFVPLAPLVSASTQILVITVADVLKFSFSGKEDPRKQLLDYLREKEMLLVMDNFEHLIEEARLLSEIIDTCPKVKFLVTSRERVQIKGEWIYELKGLDVPQVGEDVDSGQFSAMQLFVQSARRIQPDFSLDSQNMGAVINICKMVEGLPLAIELAATWTRNLSCQELLQELSKNMDFLTTRMKDSPRRHQSLRAIFDYSWELLSTHEKTIFRRLSVFNGPFLRERAQAITQASLLDLTNFVDKSLLRRKATGHYEILPLLKQYAGEKLHAQKEEEIDVRKRFCEHYAEILGLTYPPAETEKEGGLFDIIAGDIDNIRTAWSWSVEMDLWEIISKLFKNIYLYYNRRSYSAEGISVFEKTLAKLTTVNVSENDDLLRLQLTCRLGAFHQRLDDFPAAHKYLEKGLAKARELKLLEEVCFCLIQLGTLCYKQGRFDDAQKYCEENLILAEKLNNRSAMASTKNILGSIYFRKGQYHEAKKLYQETLSLNRSLEDRYTIANSLNTLGNVNVRLDNFTEARGYYEKSLHLAKEINSHKLIAMLLNNLGNLARNQGKFEEANRYVEESLAIKKDIGEPLSIGFTISVLGLIAEDRGEYDLAVTYFYQALVVLIPLRAMYYIFNIFSSVIAIAIKRGHFAIATEMIAFVKSHAQVTEAMNQIMDDNLAELRKSVPDIDMATAYDSIAKQTEEDFYNKAVDYLKRGR